MPSALTWLKAHRRLALELLAVLVALAAGWALHQPAPRLEYRDRVVYQDRVVDHVVTKTVTIREQARATQHQVHRVITTRPDGTRVETVDAATATQVDLRVGQLVAADLTHAAETTASRETSMVQTPATPPSWRLGGLVGLSAHGPVYGGEVSRRVLGPIWAGAWGLSVPAGGVSVGVEW